MSRDGRRVVADEVRESGRARSCSLLVHGKELQRNEVTSWCRAPAGPVCLLPEPELPLGLEPLAGEDGVSGPGGCTSVVHFKSGVKSRANPSGMAAVAPP